MLVYQRVKKNRMNQTPYSTTIQLHLVIFSYRSTNRCNWRPRLQFSSRQGASRNLWEVHGSFTAEAWHMGRAGSSKRDNVSCNVTDVDLTYDEYMYSIYIHMYLYLYRYIYIYIFFSNAYNYIYVYIYR